MFGRKRQDPTAELERAATRLYGEIAEAVAALRGASRPALVAATHLHDAARERIKENESHDEHPT